MPPRYFSSLCETSMSAMPHATFEVPLDIRDSTGPRGFSEGEACRAIAPRPRFVLQCPTIMESATLDRPTEVEREIARCPWCGIVMLTSDRHGERGEPLPNGDIPVVCTVRMLVVNPKRLGVVSGLS